jgi:TRAP-type mannitol/chloroaromatic compound transport system substrate-binding protein
MRNLIVGIVVGVVIGIVVGTTVVAPRLKLPVQKAADRKALNVEQTQRSASKPQQQETTKSSGAPRPARLDETTPVTHWRMASAYASKLSHMGGLAMRIEENIFKASDGRLRIKFFEPGTLVAPDKAIDAVRSGAIEAAFAAPGLWAKRNPALHLYSAIPFGPPIQEYLAWLHAEGQAMMTDIFKKLGIHGLACGLLAPEGSGWFRKPVRSLEQLKSLRVGMSGLGGEVLARLGTQVVPIAEGDVFVALESGMIDGAEAAQPTLDLLLGLHRLARHYYFPGWHQPATLLTLIINQDAWINLPSAAKTQLETLCGDNLQRGLAASEAGQFNALKSLIAEGVNIETWSPEIISALRAAWASEAAAKSKQNPDFARAWKSLQRFREEYGIWREIGRPEVPNER